jgi:TonB family protein
MHLLYKSQVVAATCLLLFSSFVLRGAAQTAVANQNKDAQEWQRYTVNDEEFSVLMPVVPAMSTRSFTIARDTKRRERILAAYADGVVYAIFTFERKNLSVDDVIRRLRLADSLTDEPTASGIAKKSSRFEDDNRLRVIHFFQTKKNFYVFRAEGSKLKDPEIGVTRFLSSIRFDEDRGGIKVEDGPGEQPVSDSSGADSSTTLRPSQLTVRATVVTKPEPRYTEMARKNHVTGTVVLRILFSSLGAVTNITTIRPLPDGLTEEAITVARQIRFIPGTKDGRFVSMWMQLEYNFNLY